MTTHPYPVSIRRATEADAAALDDLAALDETRRLDGDILLAEAGGEAVAALRVRDDAVTADPFRVTAPAVELMKVRARALRGDHVGERRLRARVHTLGHRLRHPHLGAR